MKSLQIRVLLALGALIVAAEVAAVPIVYTARVDFEAMLGNTVIDDYSNPAYLAGDNLNGSSLDIHSNAQMSSILGETDYVTTGWSNRNLIVTQSTNPTYCAGCNGSFELGFTTTSVGTANGVFGVGFDLPSSNNNGSYFGFATFGDGSTMNFAMPGGGNFWGLTSDQLITTIHFGLVDGGTTTGGAFSIDNLTIGSAAVPEPASLVLAGIALAAGGFRRRVAGAMV